MGKENVVYVHREYDSALRRSEVLPFGTGRLE